jgi:hypothetical protein
MRARERKYRFNCRGSRIKTVLIVGHATPGASGDRRRLVLADAVPGQRDERVLEGAAAGLLSQCRSGALGDDPAMIDDPMR